MHVPTTPATLRFTYTSEPQRQALFSRLVEGQTLEARVLGPLSEGRWAVRVLGHTLVAESPLALRPGQQVSARVETLGPPLILSLMGRTHAEESALNRAFQSLGLPDNTLNRAILRGLIAGEKPVTREHVLELRNLLSGLPGSDETPDDWVARALFLREKGLPVTPDTLAAFLAHLPSGTLGGMLQNLGELLRALRIRTGNAEPAAGILPEASSLTGDTLRRLITGLGLDMEGRLAAWMARGTGDFPADLQNTLRAELHRLLAQSESDTGRTQIAQALRALNTLQAANVPTESRESLYLQIPFLLDGEASTADLRIYLPSKGRPGTENLRFVLALELSGLGPVRFDLSVTQNQATCRVFGADEARTAFLQKTEAELRATLKKAGYAVSRVIVSTGPQGDPPDRPPAFGVDFRV